MNIRSYLGHCSGRAYPVTSSRKSVAIRLSLADAEKLGAAVNKAKTIAGAGEEVLITAHRDTQNVTVNIVATKKA
jgi:hypothetical protein